MKELVIVIITILTVLATGVRWRDSRKTEALAELAKEHDREALVIDSTTSLRCLWEPESAAGGFNKGLKELALWHSEFIYACEILREGKGMTVVFLAHENVESVNGKCFCFKALNSCKEKIQ